MQFKLTDTMIKPLSNDIDLSLIWPITEPKPQICPVCNGNGLVANGFYTQTSGVWSSTSNEPEKCRSCNGTGIVFNKMI